MNMKVKKTVKEPTYVSLKFLKSKFLGVVDVDEGILLSIHIFFQYRLHWGHLSKQDVKNLNRMKICVFKWK